MKVSLLILILTFFAAFSQIFSMRIWEKNLKDHIKTLKIKTKLGIKHNGKPKKVVNVNLNFSALQHKQQCNNKTQTRSGKSKMSKVKRTKMINIFWDAFWRDKCV
jgi:hypothetical protein